MSVSDPFFPESDCPDSFEFTQALRMAMTIIGMIMFDNLIFLFFKLKRFILIVSFLLFIVSIKVHLHLLDYYFKMFPARKNRTLVNSFLWQNRY